MVFPSWRRAVGRLFSSSTHRPTKRKKWPFGRLRLEVFEDRFLPSTLLVTTTADAGPGSLRQAILDANANPGLDTIAFKIGDGGVQTITVSSALPAITDPVIIDGTTQPGYAGAPLVVVNGSLFSNGPNGYGLLISGGNSTVRGLVINGFTGSDIRLQDQGNDLIAGNYIGTDVTGTQAVSGFPNVVNIGLTILTANNTIGGLSASERNLISGNFTGIFLASSLPLNNLVEGNLIGTDVNGTTALLTLAGPGVVVNAPGNTIGGTTVEARNLISGNGDGVTLGGQNNAVQGNYIGTDITGTKPLGNSTSGVRVFQGSNITIGGTAAGAGNVISGNGRFGIDTFADPRNLLIQGNYVGTDATGSTPLGNGIGISINAPTVMIGGTARGAGNLISGNTGAGILLNVSGTLVQGNFIGTDAAGVKPVGNRTGISILAAQNTIGGTTAGARNLISGSTDFGIEIMGSASTGNLVEGNFIGTDSAGSAPVRNIYGVYVASASGNTIGGTTIDARNVISANVQGVTLFSSGSNLVQGNYVGTDLTGTRALSNFDGIDLLSGSGNSIGGTAAGSGNVISGNLNDGISLFASGNTVLGNQIGTDVTGLAPLANFTGLYVSGSNNTLGGSVAGARNLISGNTLNGVDLFGSGATGNLLLGNYIGTDRTGAKSLANFTGVSVSGSGNQIGGTSAGSGNTISGNITLGISILSGATANVLEGNFVGTDWTGTLPLPDRSGISVAVGATANTIGGLAPEARNVLSGNNEHGMELLGSGNLVEGNSIGSTGAGTVPLPNQLDGILVSGTGNTIGGTVAGAANVISGNHLTGVDINGGRGNLVQGNFIGTDRSGRLSVPNNAGVSIESVSSVSASQNTIGGTLSGAGNLISGNLSLGITVGDRGNVVQGNLIGTDGTGTLALPNYFGILVGSTANTVGGTAEGARNLISGNLGPGVEFLPGSSANVLQGNSIGTDLTGSRALGNAGPGIFIDGSSNNTIGGTAAGAGNLISGNRGEGVFLTVERGNRPTANVVQGNFIGTDYTGTLALGNLVGVSLSALATDTTIGGTAAGAGNLISGNSGSGIRIDTGSAANTLVEGNYIGTDASGSQPVGNGGDGVEVISGNEIHLSGIQAPNLISGNAQDGIFLGRSAGRNISVAGNYIGTDVSGTLALRNGNNGISVLASNTTIGGTAAPFGNLISGNVQDGIHVEGSGTLIQGNFIGTDVTGRVALGNHIGVSVFSANNTVGGVAPGSGNVISGNIFLSMMLEADANNNFIQGNYLGTDVSGSQVVGNGGVSINSSNNVIGGMEPGAGNLIGGGVGIGYAGQGNLIQGNLIGTDATGTVLLKNLVIDGISISGSNNTVGGTTPEAKNVISGGYQSFAINLQGSGNLVQGNYVGTDVSGTAILGNLIGVYITGSNNTLGGTQAGAGNLISGNGQRGVHLSGRNNLLQGNFIGTDATGTIALGNADGIYINGSNNLIGGSNRGAGNLISGNVNGVYIQLGVQNQIQGNLIGVDVSGTVALGNQFGVVVAGPDNTVGGTAQGAGNIISGNHRDGIFIGEFGDRTRVQGNLIGTGISGVLPLANDGNGVYVSASDNTIGGTTTGAANTIAFNGNDGVLVYRFAGNGIRRNSIFSNAHLGIELLNGGNHNQPPPVLLSAIFDGSTLTFEGSLSSAPATSYTLEFFANSAGSTSGSIQGERFLGSFTVTTDASGTAHFLATFVSNVFPGEFLTATATDPTNNTSEFSDPAQIMPADGPGRLPTAPNGMPIREVLVAEGAVSRKGLDLGSGNEDDRLPQRLRAATPFSSVEPSLDWYFRILGEARWQETGLPEGRGHPITEFRAWSLILENLSGR